MIMKNLVCPECKNDVDTSAQSDIAIGNIVECQACGMTLEITKIDNTNFSAEIVDEGK